jgi:tyrosyl-tRNA synthetase
MGRDVMATYGREPQSIITYELLVGTDGVDKMSKSQGNYVGIDEPPEEQFGRVMSIPDSALDQWWRLCLDRDPPEAEPMESKLALARGIVELYGGAAAARAAEEHFTRVVREGRAPEAVPEGALPPGDPVHLPALLAEHFGLSTSDARRLVAQGGVKVDGETVNDLDLPRARLAGALVQAGKRRFVRFRE